MVGRRGPLPIPLNSNGNPPVPSPVGCWRDNFTILFRERGSRRTPASAYSKIPTFGALPSPGCLLFHIGLQPTARTLTQEHPVLWAWLLHFLFFTGELPPRKQSFSHTTLVPSKGWFAQTTPHYRFSIVFRLFKNPTRRPRVCASALFSTDPSLARFSHPAS